MSHGPAIDVHGRPDGFEPHYTDRAQRARWRSAAEADYASRFGLVVGWVTYYLMSDDDIRREWSVREPTPIDLAALIREVEEYVRPRYFHPRGSADWRVATPGDEILRRRSAPAVPDAATTTRTLEVTNEGSKTKRRGVRKSRSPDVRQLWIELLD